MYVYIYIYMCVYTYYVYIYIYIHIHLYTSGIRRVESLSAHGVASSPKIIPTAGFLPPGSSSLSCVFAEFSPIWGSPEVGGGDNFLDSYVELLSRCPTEPRSRGARAGRTALGTIVIVIVIVIVKVIVIVIL